MNDTTKWMVSTGVAVAFGCGSGAFAYLQYSSQQSREMGRIEAENSYLKDQLVQIKQEKEKLVGDLKAWDLAYRQKDTELSTARSRLASVQHDECEAIWLEVLRLESNAGRAQALDYSLERRQELQVQIAEHKRTHQVCLSSRK